MVVPAAIWVLTRLVKKVQDHTLWLIRPHDVCGLRSLHTFSSIDTRNLMRAREIRAGHVSFDIAPWTSLETTNIVTGTLPMWQPYNRRSYDPARIKCWLKVLLGKSMLTQAEIMSLKVLVLPPRLNTPLLRQFQSNVLRFLQAYRQVMPTTHILPSGKPSLMDFSSHQSFLCGKTCAVLTALILGSTKNSARSFRWPGFVGSASLNDCTWCCKIVGNAMSPPSSHKVEPTVWIAEPRGSIPNIDLTNSWSSCWYGTCSTSQLSDCWRKARWLRVMLWLS